MMVNRLLGLHGIRSNGSKSVDKLGLKMQERYGYSYLGIDYPHAGLLDQRSDDKLTDNAMILVDQMTEGCHVIGHSNAAGIVERAMHLCGERRFGVVNLFNPAFGAEVPWPANKFKKLVVVHNRYDRALAAGQLLYRHRFGALGRIGYHGPNDFRIVDVHSDEPRTTDWLWNHSYHFHTSRIDTTVDFCHEWIEQYG